MNQERTVANTSSAINRMNTKPLLIIAATSFELQSWLSRIELELLESHGILARKAPLPSGNRVIVALTGVGIPYSQYRLHQQLQSHSPCAVLQIGIAGAYPSSNLKIGDCVTVVEECFADVGFELPESPNFSWIGDGNLDKGFYSHTLTLGLGFSYGIVPNAIDALPQVKGCTVNMCSGTKTTGLFRSQHFKAQVETMEGAVLALLSGQEKIPAAQVRSISNLASQREMRNENILLAIKSLGDWMKINFG